MTKQRLLILVYSLVCILPISSQTFTEIGKVYPINTDGKKYVISGFVPFSHLNDEDIYANTLLWTIENICPKLREGIADINIPNKSFSCNLTLGSLAGSGQNNIFYGQATFRVADGKLVYYISNISIESSTLVMKKVTLMEKLTPEKKESHKQTMDDFAQSASLALNKLFDFVTTHKHTEITHWSEINISKPVKGMTEDECRLAFGKPQTILETNGETQWMYSSSFYLFFKEGNVHTIIK